MFDPSGMGTESLPQPRLEDTGSLSTRTGRNSASPLASPGQSTPHRSGSPFVPLEGKPHVSLLVGIAEATRRLSGGAAALAGTSPPSTGLAATATSPGLIALSPSPDAPPSILHKPTGPPQVSPSLPSAPSMGPQPVLPTPKIRFAPLPDPSRPRSLSTGRNIGWSTETDADGNEHRRMELRAMGKPDMEYETDEEAIADEEDEGGPGSHKERGRSWSKTMGQTMSWKGTKRLLTTGKLPPKSESDTEGYSSGAPLKKSISTGGMTGSSPFRWSAQEERRRSMMGLSPPGPSASGVSPGHRRNSSLEPSSAATLGASPVKVKLLNGRVYGSRRASEAAAREKESRERLEPAFIEWGHGKAGGGIGSNAPKTAGGGFLEEEGSGMEWVKRRKERREQEARERREREAQSGESGAESDAPPLQSAARHMRANGNSNDGELRSAEAPSGRAPRLSSSQSSDDERGPRTLATPNIRSSELPPTPLIRVTEVPSLSAQLNSTLRTPMSEEPPPTQAIKIAPQAAGSRRDGYGAEVFDESLPRRRGSGRSDDEGDGGDEEDEDEEDEEEEDDGDFEDDEEEEEDVGRTTATAAGIEVVSRHH